MTELHFANTDTYCDLSSQSNSCIKTEVYVKEEYGDNLKEDTLKYTINNSGVPENNASKDLLKLKSLQDYESEDSYVKESLLNHVAESEDEEHSNLSSEEGTKCKICEKVFSLEEELVLHCSARRLPDSKYVCCKCNKVFQYKDQLKVHARKHTGEKPFSCNICGKKFTVSGNAKKHMSIHTGERKFECEDCGKKFTQLIHLKDHMNTHSGERPFVCEHCHKGFKTNARLRRHIKGHQNKKKGRILECPKCDIILSSTGQLTDHLNIHVLSGNGPYKCHFCNEIFRQPESLKKHQKNHIMTKFDCHLCERRFKIASNFRRHLDSHAGARPFSCTICDSSFPTRQNMKRHMMTHTGEKPFPCVDCNRSFPSQESLNRHRRTHTGEKPYTCGVCQKSFAHRTTFTDHFKAFHSKEKPFCCKLCGKSFAVSRVYYRHIKTTHPDYFPQFKKEHDLPPNVKKTRDVIKKEPGRIEFVSVNDSYSFCGQSKEDNYDIKDEQMCNDFNDIKVENHHVAVEKIEEVIIKQEGHTEEDQEILEKKIKIEPNFEEDYLRVESSTPGMIKIEQETERINSA